jgi:hypothetical protein
MIIIPPEIIGKTTIATNLAAEQAAGKRRKNGLNLSPPRAPPQENILQTRSKETSP